MLLSREQEREIQYILLHEIHTDHDMSDEELDIVVKKIVAIARENQKPTINRE